MSAKRKRVDDDISPPILTLSIALLAMVLSPAYLDIGRLLLVCKRFGLAVMRPEFWMPAIRERLRRFIPKTHIHIIDRVNPFFRFPSHMWMCPGWPWWAFLHWLLPSDNNNNNKPLCKKSRAACSIVDGVPRISIYHQEMDVLVFEENHTFWYPDNCRKGGEYPPICCGKCDLIGGSVYRVVVNGKYVWIDGILYNYKHGGLWWCGAVSEAGEDGNGLILTR